MGHLDPFLMGIELLHPLLSSPPSNALLSCAVFHQPLFNLWETPGHRSPPPRLHSHQGCPWTSLCIHLLKWEDRESENKTKTSKHLPHLAVGGGCMAVPTAQAHKTQGQDVLFSPVHTARLIRLCNMEPSSSCSSPGARH